MGRIAALTPDALIVFGVACLLGGVFMLLGVAWVLIVGGVMAAAYGALLDAMTPDRRRAE